MKITIGRETSRAVQAEVQYSHPLDWNKWRNNQVVKL